MAPTSSTLISSGSKKKEPRYWCLSEAKTSHSHKMCTEVSSSMSHFLQSGSLLSHITCKCLLRVLCPASRPTTALVCVLLNDSNRTPVARLGPWEADSFSANQKLSFYDLSILKIDIPNGTLSSVFPIKIQFFISLLSMTATYPSMSPRLIW